VSDILKLELQNVVSHRIGARNIFVFILCVWVFCLHGYLCNMYVPGAQRGQKRLSDPVKQE
jgi:hypothetical protein